MGRCSALEGYESDELTKAAVIRLICPIIFSSCTVEALVHVAAVTQLVHTAT